MEKSLNNKELRKSIKTLRDSIPLENRESLSCATTKNILALLESDFKGANIFLCFYPFASEVDLRQLYKMLLEKGKRLFFPKSDVTSHVLTFYEVKDLDLDFEKGAYGIMEPKSTLPEPDFNSEQVVVFVPGLVFDLCCNRLGYGAGYYDRFFANHSDFIKIGVAFEQQIIDALNVEAHDVPLDYIVTDDRLIKRGAM